MHDRSVSSGSRGTGTPPGTGCRLPTLSVVSPGDTLSGVEQGPEERRESRVHDVVVELAAAPAVGQRPGQPARAVSVALSLCTISMSGSSTAGSVLATDFLPSRHRADEALELGADEGHVLGRAGRAVRRVAPLGEEHFAHQRIPEPLHLVVHPGAIRPGHVVVVVVARGCQSASADESCQCEYACGSPSRRSQKVSDLALAQRSRLRSPLTG